MIKKENTSELLRFTIPQILNQLHNNLIYPILEEEEQKKAQSNQQQQLVNQGTLRPDTASHHQAPKLYQTSNLRTLKTTPSSSISLVPTKTNTFYDNTNLSNDYSQIKALEPADRQSDKRE